MSDPHSGGSHGPNPWMILGMAIAAGLGAMFFLTMFGTGLQEFGRDVANFSIGFRIGKQDLFFFFLMILLIASLAKLVFGGKGGGHH